MTHVQVAWLTLVLAPLGLIGLVVGLIAKVSASRRGEPMPGWGNAAQGMAIVLVLLMAVMNMAVSGS